MSVGDLLDAGLVVSGEWLRSTREKEEFWVEVLDGGWLRDEDGQVYSSLSGAGAKLRGTQSCQGWATWHKQREGRWIPMAEIRQEAIDKGFLESPGD